MKNLYKVNYIKTFIIGIILGVANVIPGISGATMAVSLNVFDKLINAININKWKDHLNFLAPLCVGAILGIFAFSNVILTLKNNYPLAVNFAFIGIILGSLPSIFKKALGKDKKVKLLNSLLCIFAFGIMITFSYLEQIFMPNDEANIWEDNYRLLFILLLISSSIAAMAMVIPGISGSLIMLILGIYPVVMEGISTLDFYILLPVFIGSLIGIIIGIAIIKKALLYFPQALYFSILGLVAGSVIPIYPGFFLGTEGYVAILVAMIFTIVSYISSIKE